MSGRVSENSFVAIVGAAAGAIATAIINNLLLSNTNIGYWGIGAFLGVIVAFLLYFWYQQGFGRFPIQIWRVTNAADGTGLGSDGQLIIRNGRAVCQFETNYVGWAIWGPGHRTQDVVQKGNYKADFRIKVNHKSGANLPFIEISVAARTDDGLGTKFLAARTLSPIDFRENDEYQVFSLFFEVVAPEHEFELRVYSKGHNRIVTLDHVKVTRTLF